MLDIFAALIEELLGVKKQKQAQPRRVTRRDQDAADSADASQYRQPQRQASPFLENPKTEEPQPFDDLIRQFFGIPEDEPVKTEDMREEPDIPPPPSRPLREPRAEQRRRPEPEQPEPVAQPVSPAAVSLSEPTGRKAKTMRAAAGPGENVSGRELAERLGRDPQAARTAFIYAEILGPPAADKF